MNSQEVIVNYIFTPQLGMYLADLGFRLESENHLDKGYKLLSISLTNLKNESTALQYYEVHDEELFLNHHPTLKKEKPFVPTLAMKNLNKKTVLHPNGVNRFYQIISKSSQSNEYDLYLETHKEAGIKAVHLLCEEFNKLIQDWKFDRIFQHQSKKVGLIHFGTGCVDILVSESLP